MNNNPYLSLGTKKYYPFATMIIVTLLLIALHFFMVYRVFPYEENVMNIYVASRAGGTDFYQTTQEFITISYWAIGLSVAAALFILFLTYKKSKNALVLLTILLTSAAMIYTGIYLGNAFDALWGEAWSVLGVVAPLFVMLALGFPLLVNDLLKSKVSK